MRSAKPESESELDAPKSATGAWSKIAILILLSGGVIVSHYSTPATDEQMILHDLYRRVLYIPIILSAFWFGWRGGIICALSVTIAYFPHIYHDWGGGFFHQNLNRTLEAGMYVVVGSITGYLIDKLRREQARLIEANADLARQSEKLQATMDELTHKTREVFETEEQLRRADRLSALGQLSSGLAHEIRNPLGSIRGAAEILSDPAVVQARREEFGGILIEETKRLDTVLGNFLQYAREQKTNGNHGSDLGKVLDRLLALMDKQLSGAQVEVETAIKPDFPTLSIPEPLLQQVLMNVVLNAVQAMPTGGKLRIAAIPESSLQASITFEDTGPGIPKDIANRIFDPFVTSKPQGSGLGLSIVHKIVSAHHGTVAADTDYSSGARIRITLPATNSGEPNRKESQ